MGLVVFVGCALAAALVDPEAGHYIAATSPPQAGSGTPHGTSAHHRDLSRHEAVGVVPRGYAEFCIVVDLLVGASLIAAPVA